ncbi:LPXTG cell wall anchor domain-containing protein [Streptomyces sp. NPDC006553]|uniref:LPXTG cell wall anchor domain-containing protein n=1 Tax=Streptomyces sp. NPDC006553 TaxID=3157180 RepID=UPI0033BB1D24
MRRSLIPAAALVATMAGSLVLAPVASASEAPKPAPLPLHQVEDLPLTAGEFGEKGECPTVPAGKDGWHFVLPGSGKGDSAVFTKLTVEFEPGGIQTITTFGPPSDKHAYATSEPGAKLVSASAEVSAPVKQGWFNLSHTCPATPVTETPGTETPGTETPGTETPGTETPGTETPGTETPGTETPGTETPGTETPAPSETTPGASETPGGTESPSASTPAGETGGNGGTGSTGGDLAETGAGAPVGVLAAVAVALAGAGAFLVTRRRKAQQH